MLAARTLNLQTTPLPTSTLRWPGRRRTPLPCSARGARQSANGRSYKPELHCWGGCGLWLLSNSTLSGRWRWRWFVVVAGLRVAFAFWWWWLLLPGRLACGLQLARAPWTFLLSLTPSSQTLSKLPRQFATHQVPHQLKMNTQQEIADLIERLDANKLEPAGKAARDQSQMELLPDELFRQVLCYAPPQWPDVLVCKQWLLSIDFSHQPINDHGLAAVLDLASPRLENINIVDCHPMDGGIESLAACTRLRCLAVRVRTITAEFISQLAASLTQLRSLTLKKLRGGELYHDTPGFAHMP